MNILAQNTEKICPDMVDLHFVVAWSDFVGGGICSGAGS
jgi:hypothetical protein